MVIINRLKVEKTHYTPEEYIMLEEKSQEKHEYRDGEIIPMTGGTTNHNKLALKMASMLLSFLEDQDYEVYMGDVRLWIEKFRYYTYPDVMVVKGKPIYEGKGTTTIVNPHLIVEVLSISTKDYDQNDKFEAYRSLPEFQEYILIDQYQYYVKQFAKNRENKWVLTDYYGKKAVLKLESINFDIAMKELYKKVNFHQT